MIKIFGLQLDESSSLWHKRTKPWYGPGAPGRASARTHLGIGASLMLHWICTCIHVNICTHRKMYTYIYIFIYLYYVYATRVSLEIGYKYKIAMLLGNLTTNNLLGG